jgi:GNAT superfamily N-acetyltransferase
MHKESPRFSRFAYDPDRCLSLLQKLHLSGVILLAEEREQIVGMILGGISEHFFGRGTVASELVVYVAPESRGGTAAMRMLKAFEDWAFSKGADEIVLGVSTEVHAKRTAEFYQRLGYEMSGYTCIKRCA